MGERAGAMEKMEGLNPFYKGKKVFVTGHTGFKGAWMCKVLADMGAKVTGYALEPPTEPNLFYICELEKEIHSVIGDVRDFEHLKTVVNETEPEIVFHLAAQPIVRESYLAPLYTYETNVMGTANLLECVRQQSSIRSVVNVTTDKVYDNRETDRAYREEDILDGYDPYSNSKSCSELVTHSYKRSFFSEREIAVSTARAGNVIGGGDFAKDRIVPDCVRAAEQNREIIVRNPYSIRPYQHVLDPIFAYLLIAKRQYEKPEYQGCYNVGPDDCDCVTTARLVDVFCEKWGGGIHWVNQYDGGPHEAGFLKLNCDLLKAKMDWKPRWGVEKAVENVVQWTKAYFLKENVSNVMNKQIGEFLSE